MAPLDSYQQVFRKLPLYMSSLDRLREEHIIDVMKLGVRPGKKKLPSHAQKGVSDGAQAAREALAADPYNMFWINELAYKYIMNGDVERAANVMLRGWKRVNEIEDSRVRFCFLMKLAEVSYFRGRFRQAAAVLQDIVEPEDREGRKAYHIMSCHIYGANKEVQKTLEAFRRAIEGEDFQLSVRILALTVMDLKEVGMYSVAKSAVERVASEMEKDSLLAMLDSFATKEPDKSMNPDDVQKYFIIGIVVAVASVLLYFLYLAEQWSLGKIKK